MRRDCGNRDERSSWRKRNCWRRVVSRLVWLCLPALVVACERVADLNSPRVAPPLAGSRLGVFLANCSKTSIPGLVSIPQLGAGTYLGEQGGMYPGGSNTIPPAHLTLGLSLASEVQPRDANGNPDPTNGKIVQISFGASTAVRVFAGDSAMMNGIIGTAYKPYSDADPAKNPKLVIVNTAQANKPLKYWLDPADSAWIIADQRLATAGVTPAQVQVGWFMIAEGRAPTTTFPQEARNYRDSMEFVIRFAKSRYPNMKLGFLTTHYYQGYRPGNTEPQNYEQGFGLKWVIEDQITGQRNMNADSTMGPVTSPWLGWARHLWTNGIIPNADGLFFLCSDYDSNGVHFMRPGVDKAGPSLEAFFKTDPTTVSWWLNNTGQIGDRVWHDVDGNGIQDAGEPGLPGVTVTLAGPAVDRIATTDANGDYLFSSVPAGTYTVSAATPGGYVASPTGQGGDPLADSNGSPAAVTLDTNGSTDLSIDIGFTQQLIGQIGDLVWADTNGDGIQDAGEPGLAGVSVTLGGAASATTTTDAAGHYLFAGLLPGTYTVAVAAPSGFHASPSQQGSDAQKDSDPNPATVTLSTPGAANTSVDFGFVPDASGSIGDYVWYDADGNGVQDAGEVGLAGVSVTLSGPGGTVGTTTDGTGQYLFTGLAAGSYTVTVTTPAGYVLSPSNQGGDSSRDSDGSPATVQLATSASNDLSIDVGFTRGAGSIGDFVWNDLNFNGIQDAGEPGLSGVTVTLSGAASATTTTAANGSYAFNTLFAGAYTVTVTKPTGYSPTLSNQGADPLADSNDSPATVTLATNASTSPGTDFGFVLGQIITVDNTSSTTSAAAQVTTLSWSHKVTASGTNRILLVSVGIRAKTSQTVSTVKWGGAKLTRIRGVTQGTAVRSELWYLINPPTGIRTITVTLSGAATSAVAGAVSYTGVHQTTPLGAAVSKVVSANKVVSVAVTSAVREVVVDAVVKQNALEGVTPAAGQVQRWTNKTSRATGSDNVVGAASERAGAPGLTMSWSSPVARAWAMVAVPLKPAP